ncbi:muconolactone Delta-isomerase family protein [Streptomyces sp. NPDC127033]|uniref:muconolactone Delta-isomerase family protein n=1 Tax=Streptomyces sp. NPDC127033 TaxID=3347110 RepID=UPI00366378B2
MREFLVEIITTKTEVTSQEEVYRQRACEAIHAEELAAAGHLARLWRPVGEQRSIGVQLTADEGELHERVLDTLPLRPWMALTVTALEPHPNDPGARRLRVTPHSPVH